MGSCPWHAWYWKRAAVCADRIKKAKAEAVQKELSPLGPVAVIAANLMTEEGMETIRHEINASHRDISLMVNAAGIFMPKGLPSTALPIMT